MGQDIGLQMVVIEEDALTVIRKLQKDHTDRSEMGFSYLTAYLLVQASKWYGLADNHGREDYEKNNTTTRSSAVRSGVTSGL
ncbi:hypothetical protein PVK06_035168 [Gossypium arboreum]|uniref:Uncharacterized protein n=1 Tax=Gossypium arboreum TaxID=29729 RepID=A0ABR0NIE6_GOSAR|nr:hypothetical protein PVK06_035168 [Gossypium arboreum]